MTMQLVGWAIVQSLWQGGLIALVVALLFSVTRDSRPSVRYAIGLAGLVLMIALPAATVIRSLRTSSAPVAQLILANPPGRVVPVNDVPMVPSGDNGLTLTPSRQSDYTSPLAGEAGTLALRGIVPKVDGFVLKYLSSALPWLALLWIVGLFAASLRLLGGFTRTRRMTRVGVTPAVEVIKGRVEVLSRLLGIDRTIGVISSVNIDVPMVVGALRPVIVVPASLVTGLTPLQLDMLLAHELAHVRRYDFLVNLFQTVIETLLFYHPAASWLSKRIREERENCCDDIAIAVSGGDARGYTETLLTLEESRAGEFNLAASASGGSLFKRAHRLMTGRSAHVELGPRWIAGVVTIAAALLAGRDAAASGVEASFSPVSFAVSGVKDTLDDDMRDPDPTRGAPASVVKSAVNGSLADRWSWANSQSRRSGKYWIGYLVSGAPGATEYYYADDIPVRIGKTTTMNGHMKFGPSIERFRFAGVPLGPVVGSRSPGSTAVFVLMNDGMVQRVTVRTFAIPMYFDKRPVFWLDSASDGQSIEVLRSLMSNARDDGTREDIVAAIGFHQDISLVIPQLAAYLQSTRESAKVRSEAADWLGRTNDPRAVAALSRAVRTDPLRDVRDEAVEAFADMPGSAATDSLFAFAGSLDDEDLRRTAIESLGDRDDPKALSYLTQIASTSSNDQFRKDALEAIADLPDGRGHASIERIARTDRDPAMRREAVEYIADFAPTSRALELLHDIARADTDEDVQGQAAESIADIKDVRSIAVLRDLAENASSEHVRKTAIESLGETVDDAAGLAALRTIVRSHADPEMRKKALEAIGSISDEATATQILLDVIATEKDSDVRDAALEALGDLDDKAAIPALRKLASSSPDADVRAKAKEMLSER